MRATLFADASYDHTTQCYGWAMWVRLDGWDRGKYYSTPDPYRPRHSQDAELKALVNAIMYFKELHPNEFEALQTIYVQSDCLDALYILLENLDHAYPMQMNAGDLGIALTTRSPTTLNPTSKLWIKDVNDVLQGIHVGLKHVKAHRGSRTPRTHINETCDNMARRAMRLARDGVQS